MQKLMIFFIFTSVFNLGHFLHRGFLPEAVRSKFNQSYAGIKYILRSCLKQHYRVIW